jgi:hypothetical protein
LSSRGSTDTSTLGTDHNGDGRRSNGGNGNGGILDWRRLGIDHDGRGVDLLHRLLNEDRGGSGDSNNRER